MFERSIKILLTITIVLILFFPPAISASYNGSSSKNIISENPETTTGEPGETVNDKKNNDPLLEPKLNLNQMQYDSMNLNFPSSQSYADQQPEYTNQYFDNIKFNSNPDGTTTAEFFIKPSLFLNSEHEQQYIDNRLERFDETANMISDIENINEYGYEFQCVKNNLKMFTHDTYVPSSEKNLLRLYNSNNNYPITWQPLGMAIGDRDTPIDGNLGSEYLTNLNFNIANAEVKGNEIEFKDIFPGGDDRYTITSNNLKHDIIINDNLNDLLLDHDPRFFDPEKQTAQTDPLSVDFYGLLNLPDDIAPYTSGKFEHSAFKTLEAIQLKNQNDEVIYNLSPSVAYESEDDGERIRCTNILIPLNPDNLDQNSIWSRTLFIVRVELDWLVDKTRSYPIVIDPSFWLPKEGSKGMDTYIVKGNETNQVISSFNFGQQRDLKISLAGPSLYSRYNFYYRSILKFPGLDILTGQAQITEAKLILFLKSTGDEELAITAFRLYDDWLEGDGTDAEPSNTGASWNYSGYNVWLGGNYDGHNTDATTVVVSSPNTYVWDVLEIVEYWVKNPDKNYGFLLSGSDYEDVIKIFHSSEALVGDVRPKLSIKYNTPPAHTGLDEIIINEDETRKDIKLAPKNKDEEKALLEGSEQFIFYDPDIITASHEDSLSFYIWDGTYDKGRLKFVSAEAGGLYSSENLTIKLRIDDQLEIRPAGAEKDGEDTVPLMVKDRYTDLSKKGPLIVPIKFKIKSINDEPRIISIGNKPVFDDIVELSATEGLPEDFTIVVDDPDNPVFLEGYITNRTHNAPADLDFDWEKEKTKKFTIEESADAEGNPFAKITFNPNNDLVGLFYMNVTVYDNYWNKPYEYSKLKKVRVSNYTVMIIFDIANVNNPPSDPRIIEPFYNEFNADQLITFKGRCNDPDLNIPESSEILTFTWTSDKDGPLGEGKEIRTKLSKNKHVINLTVKDSSGLKKVISTNITVRNRVTLSEENCSYKFTDDSDDVLGFYYSTSGDGEKEYYIMRDSGYPEYDIYIDIVELTSIKFRNYLLINLTMAEDMRIQDTDNYKYRFSIYLIKPVNDEIAPDIKDMEYNSRLFEGLYSPEKAIYYAVFGLDDGNIINNGRTLAIRKHIGDLEYGEDINQPLKADFTIYASLKVELKQHPEDNFEHIICYDTAGFGSKPAPIPQKRVEVDEKKDEGLEIEVGLVISILVICIIIAFAVVLYIRKRKLDEERDREMTIDTTQQQLQLQMPVPGFGSAPWGPGMGVGMGMHPGTTGAAGPGVGFGGPGSITPQVPLGMQMPPSMFPMLPPGTQQKKPKDKKKLFK